LGEIVEQSINSVLGSAFANKPASPRYKPSTWREAGSMLINTSAPFAVAFAF